MHSTPCLALSLLTLTLGLACTAASEPSKSEPAKSEPSKSEPAKSEPSKSEPAKPLIGDGPVLSQPTEIFGLMQTREGLTLQIESGGCRKTADVGFATNAGKLSIASLVPDTCEGDVVLGTKLLFAWADLPAFVTLGIELGPVEVLEPGTNAGPSIPPEGARDEPIYGVLVSADGLDVRVDSGGCTQPEHFTAFVEPGETALVHLVRTQPDMCEAYVAEGELIHFTWAQLGVTAGKARVVNPLRKLVIKQ